MTGRFVPPPLGPYQYHEVLSALRKEIKLANLDEAIYWANVILTFSDKPATGQRTLAKQLWVMSSEDLYSTEVTIRAYICMETAGKIAETDQLFYLVALMCRAPKWWESEEGRAVDIAWAKAIGDIKDPATQHPMPSYALDRHTHKGWNIFKKTGRFDDRFTGTDLGRQKTSWLFQKYGTLSADQPDPADDPHFRGWWSSFRNLMRAGPKDLEPNDPIGEEGLLPPPPRTGQGDLFEG